ncbi:AfsR/SARP family transcriptional regulator [Micromonospora sp. LOL_015]|uniref:AfsR/SARP family transcriptional regulator n=1 Tax=Micromonospora sp. LOL_015 TaxID=3345416 RepID=UPI003A8ACF83
MESLRINLLGVVCGRRGSADLDMGSPQQQALLVVLLLRPGQAVSAAVLMEALWGDDPPVTATKSLRTYAWRWRKVLEKDVAQPRLLTTVGDGYRPEVPEDAIDVRCAEALARRASRAGDARSARAMLAAAGRYHLHPLVRSFALAQDVAGGAAATGAAGQPLDSLASAWRRAAAELPNIVALGRQMAAGEADLLRRLVDLMIAMSPSGPDPRAEPTIELLSVLYAAADHAAADRAGDGKVAERARPRSPPACAQSMTTSRSCGRRWTTWGCWRCVSVTTTLPSPLSRRRSGWPAGYAIAPASSCRS